MLFQPECTLRTSPLFGDTKFGLNRSPLRLVSFRFAKKKNALRGNATRGRGELTSAGNVYGRVFRDSGWSQLVRI